MFLDLCLEEEGTVSKLPQDGIYSLLYLLVVVVLVVVLEDVVVLELIVVLEVVVVLVVIVLLEVVDSEVVVEPEFVVDGVVVMLPAVEETVRPGDVLVEADLTVQARS